MISSGYGNRAYFKHRLMYTRAGDVHVRQWRAAVRLHSARRLFRRAALRRARPPGARRRRRQTAIAQ